MVPRLIHVDTMPCKTTLPYAKACHISYSSACRRPQHRGHAAKALLELSALCVSDLHRYRSISQGGVVQSVFIVQKLANPRVQHSLQTGGKVQAGRKPARYLSLTLPQHDDASSDVGST